MRSPPSATGTRRVRALVTAGLSRRDVPAWALPKIRPPPHTKFTYDNCLRKRFPGNDLLCDAHHSKWRPACPRYSAGGSDRASAPDRALTAGGQREVEPWRAVVLLRRWE